MTKWTFAAVIALFVAACSHGRLDSRVAVLVEVPGPECLDTSRNDRIPLTITNRSAGRIAFFAAKASGPPYVLHPYAFAIDFTEPKSENNVEALLDEYVPPKHEVQLGPGDREEVLAYAVLWPRPGYSGKVRAQLIDTNGRQYLSKELGVCTTTEMSASGR